MSAGYTGTLEDVESIRSLLNRYAYAIDDFRFADMERLFTEDVTVNFPQFSMSGRSGFADRLSAAIEGTAFMMHMSTNLEISFADQDNAASKSYLIGYGMRKGDETLLTEGGAYDHRFRRARGAWRISAITFTPKFRVGF